MKLRILRNSDSREDVPIDRLGVACLDNLRLVVRRTTEEAGSVITSSWRRGVLVEMPVAQLTLAVVERPRRTLFRAAVHLSFCVEGTRYEVLNSKC